MTTYELKLEQFSGPLGKLLELIEAQKLEVTEISLAQVTDDFLKYLKTLEEVHASVIADFIVIASRLIFLKSKVLIPNLVLTEEEESEIKDLERRLKLYQEFKPALKYVSDLWNKNGREFSRPYFLNLGDAISIDHKSIFYPGNSLSQATLQGSLQKIFETIKNLELESQTIKEKIVTIEEKMQEIVKRLELSGGMSFKTLAEKMPVSEIIAIFLAILHLAREQRILIEQEGNFSDIMISKSEERNEISENGGQQ